MKAPMKRVNFHFPQQLMARLRKSSERTGLPVSEIVRSAVEAALRAEEMSSEQATKPPE